MRLMLYFWKRALRDICSLNDTRSIGALVRFLPLLVWTTAQREQTLAYAEDTQTGRPEQ